ncbi:hypothetical protein BECAL_03011 [Bellilinea caldifistulae]|uniref:Uncharacterized protein n=2 Tax=Bellilinea caldifistulae TaxID=360411 RepID=A0A0P6X421_9CHLR|nr:hypothetical protein AC812_12465 [Bellilinea caldifistulae]GAP11817.1 hypothetical protein BECAL_03011 [Bellilinea caldifistulae]
MQSNPDTTLSAIRTYTLIIDGELDVDFAAAFCPPDTMLEHDGKTLRLTNLRVDQSGLLGIIRSLHNLGCVLVSLSIDTGEIS